MSASVGKRIAAYVVDILIVSIIFSCITFFIPQSDNVKALNNEMDEINELFLKNEIKMGPYIYRYSAVVYQLDKEKVFTSIISFILILAYFVILPYFQDGQTIGKRWFKIKIVREDGDVVTINDLVIRNFVVNGLLYMIVGLASIYVVPSLVYFILISILGLGQIILIIVSIFMILYRKDRKGIQDMITKTKVIEYK